MTMVVASVLESRTYPRRRWDLGGISLALPADD